MNPRHAMRPRAWSGVPLLVLAASLLAHVVLAQPPRAGVVTNVIGSATVERAGMPPMPLQFKDEIFLTDRIATRDASKLQILLSSKAVVTMLERSELTVSETAAAATIGVSLGRIKLVVVKERLRPGEAIELATLNAIAAVRGTVLIAEVRAEAPCEADPRGIVTRFTVLAGAVDVVARREGEIEDASGPSFSLHKPDTISISRCTMLGGPRELAGAEAHALDSSFAFRVPGSSSPRRAPLLPRLHP